MTTVSSTPPKVSDSLLESVNPKKKGAKSEVEATQDRFMTLLVTQMRNQDPLNPLDNAQVTSQFAQLSTVSSLEKLNQAFSSLAGSYAASQSIAATSMISRGVLVEGNDMVLSEGKGAFGVEMTEPADKVTVTIKNAGGVTMRTMQLGALEAGTHPLGWDGKTDKGETAPDGMYQIEIAATRGEEKAKATTLQFDIVQSVTTNAQGIKLNLPHMGAVNMGDVKQIL